MSRKIGNGGDYVTHIDSYLSRVLSENGLSFLDDLYELYDFVPNETLRQLLAAFHTGLNNEMIYYFMQLKSPEALLFSFHR